MAEKDRTAPLASHPLVEKALAFETRQGCGTDRLNIEEISGGRAVGCLQAARNTRIRSDALIDAGIVRTRPVLITIAATVLGLFPLALHGDPLWDALCYAQIGGLSFTTLVTLFIVPVI